MARMAIKSKKPSQSKLISADIKIYLSGGRRGDTDNYVKAVLDGCNGIVYYDDRQIIRIMARIINTEDKKAQGIRVVFGDLDDIKPGGSI